MTASPYFILLVLLIIGVALYGVGTILVRSANKQPDAAPSPSLQWTREFFDSDEALDAVTRIDMIERLAFIGEPWCVEILTAASVQEHDPSVRAAIIAGLLRGSTSP